ncbi:MAG TPA: protein kinase [Polyangiaceae bacterium]
MTAPGDPFGWVEQTVAGKYRVDAVVAEGGFGVVYRAMHIGLHAPIALKCLKLPARLQGAERERFLEAFLAEGRLLHQLSRSTAGIVQALDVGAEVSPSGAWTPYLALEWLEGSALDAQLADRARRGMPGFSLAEAVALLAPAAQGLALAHEQGVAHRDLKPGNLFVAEIGGKRVCKVVDFGIAKVVADVSNVTRALQETGGTIQAFTPLYGAPEQFDRRYGATGPWTDVFAFALVMVEMMTGRPALDGADTTQLFVASTRPDRRPTPRGAGVAVTDATEAIFARALSVDPKDRYRSLGALWPALVAEAARGPAVDPLGATAYGPAPPGAAAFVLASTALAPTMPGPAQAGVAATAAATNLAHPAPGPSTTAPYHASLPAIPPPGALPYGPPAASSKTWIGVLIGGLALVVIAAVAVSALVMRGGRTSTPAGSPLAGSGGNAMVLRASAAQKVTRKDPTCLADFEAADRAEPGGTPPALEPARAFCEMIAGRCEAGRKRYRTYVNQTNPAGGEAAVNAVTAMYCPRDQLTPVERVFALTADESTAWQKGDTGQCVTVGNELLGIVDSLPDHNGAQQNARMQAVSGLVTAAQCAAKGGRCDEARAFYLKRLAVLTKQPPTPAIEAGFRSAYPECGRKP